MALFQTIAVSAEEVSRVVAKHWNLELGKLIKGSQNHTFAAKYKDNDEDVVVRVTPDPEKKHLGRIEREIAFVNFIAAQEGVQHVCRPVAAAEGGFVVVESELIFVVYEWAKGEPVDFMSYKWMTDKEFVLSWGRWLGHFHRASQRFSQAQPELAQGIQRWDEIHEGIMRDAAIDAADQAVVSDPAHFGVLHGDLNTSNFFYLPQERTLSVFDWDQTQRGWFLWDVAQAELGVYMLAGAGSLVDGSVVAEADPQRFENWFVEGYESVRGAGSVDRARLARMVDLRMYFYETFCRTAKEQGNLPPDMEYFINYIVNWFDRRASEKATSSQA